MEESLPTDWNFPSDDVESEYLHFSLIDDAAQAVDFHHASALVKVAWIFCVTKYPVYRDDDPEE